MAKKRFRLWDFIQNLIFPCRCVFCRKLLPPHTSQRVCLDCMNHLPFAISYSPRCRRCGRPIDDGEKLCRLCKEDKHPTYTGISAPYLYQESVKAALLRFKLERYRGYAKVFAEHMDMVLTHDHPKAEFDLVVAVPPRKKRMRKVGYDQAAHLAKTLAKKKRLPYVAGVLRQKKVREKQSSLSRGARFYNVIGNIKVKKPKAVAGKRILLVDDITTTGATLKESARMLSMAGAQTVHCVTVALVE